MARSFRPSRRTSVLAFALLGAFVTGVTAKLALAQEVKCYLMVCTGTTCVATQIKCPEDPKKPAPPPE